MRGHSVLQLPVPALEEWVRGRTQYYDAAFVSSDPAFVHAHITALSPFDPEPTPAVLDRVAAIATSTPPLVVQLAELDQFPDGIIHLVPDPSASLSRLADRLVAEFPGYPPYGGQFEPTAVPHLTLDLAAPDVSVASTRLLLGDVVPVTCRLGEWQLAWWEARRCHVLASWLLDG